MDSERLIAFYTIDAFDLEGYWLIERNISGFSFYFCFTGLPRCAPTLRGLAPMSRAYGRWRYLFQAGGFLARPSLPNEAIM